MLIKSEHQEYHGLAAHNPIGNEHYYLWFRNNKFIKNTIEWKTVKQTLNQLVKE